MYFDILEFHQWGLRNVPPQYQLDSLPSTLPRLRIKAQELTYADKRLSLSPLTYMFINVIFLFIVKIVYIYGKLPRYSISSMSRLFLLTTAFGFPMSPSIL